MTDWTQRFPDAELIAGGEGGAVYAAQGEGAWWVITDESLLADLLGDDDLAAYVHVRRFDDERAWRDAIDVARRRAGIQVPGDLGALSSEELQRLAIDAVAELSRRGVLWTPGASRLPLPIVPPNAPHAIRLTSGGTAGPAVEITWTGLGLLYERSDPRIGAIEVVPLYPTRRRWAEFWEAVARIGVWDWEASYTQDAADDGPCWSIDIASPDGELQIVATGDNTWPQDWHEFCQAVRTLIEGRPFF